LWYFFSLKYCEFEFLFEIFILLFQLSLKMLLLLKSQLIVLYVFFAIIQLHLQLFQLYFYEIMLLPTIFYLGFLLASVWFWVTLQLWNKERINDYLSRTKSKKKHLKNYLVYTINVRRSSNILLWAFEKVNIFEKRSNKTSSFVGLVQWKFIFDS